MRRRERYSARLSSRRCPRSIARATRMLLVLAMLEIEPWSAESATPATRRHAPQLAGVSRRRQLAPNRPGRQI